MPPLQDKAVCIRLADWSETSQIVVLLTERHGKVSAAARGAKRRNPSALAKFSGGIELLSLGEAVWYQKSGSELANLAEWDLLEPHRHLRKNLLSYQLAMYAADLLHHLVQDRDPHPQSFGALGRFLAGLSEPETVDRHLLEFQWSVLTDLGLHPVLDRDAQTGEALDEQAPILAFSASAGGLVADTGASDRWRLRRETALALRALDRGALPARIDDETCRRANRLLCVYYRHVLERQLPTMDVILEARPEEPRGKKRTGGRHGDAGTRGHGEAGAPAPID